MGQTTIFIILAAVLGGSILLVNMQRDTEDADQQLNEYQYKLLARDQAVTGLNLAVRKLADSYQMESWNGTSFDIPLTSYNNGSFSVDVEDFNTNSGDTVDVVARGVYGPGRAVIFARYARDEDDKGIPPAFRNVIASDLQLTIDGNLLIDAIDNSLNASVHSNEWVYVESNSFLVEGYGTYVTEPDKSIKEKLQERFVPNEQIYDDGINLRQIEDIVEIPSVDEEKLYSEAQESGVIANGSITLDGPIDFTDPNSDLWSQLGVTYNCSGSSCGTEENPFVVYVEGDLAFDNTVLIEGYGTIFSKGNITIDGEGTYGYISEDKETQVLLATQQDITIGNNTCLGLGPSSYTRDASQPEVNTSTSWNNNNCNPEEATGPEYPNGISLYAEGTVLSSGTPFIVGGVVAKNAEFNSKGNPWIAYASPTESVIDSGFEYIVPIGPILIAYSEF